MKSFNISEFFDATNIFLMIVLLLMWTFFLMVRHQVNRMKQEDAEKKAQQKLSGNNP